MSEPKAVAETLKEVVPGVWRWRVLDDRIGSKSDAHAVSDRAGTVLIDPLPLRDEALKKLEPIIAVCLTAACHQRSAWRYTRTFGVSVYAPEECRAMDEGPDGPVSRRRGAAGRPQGRSHARTGTCPLRLLARATAGRAVLPGSDHA